MSCAAFASWLFVTALLLAIIGSQTGVWGGVAYGASTVFLIAAFVAVALGLEFRKP